MVPGPDYTRMPCLESGRQRPKGREQAKFSPVGAPARRVTAGPPTTCGGQGGGREDRAMGRVGDIENCKLKNAN